MNNAIKSYKALPPKELLEIDSNVTLLFKDDQSNQRWENLVYVTKKEMEKEVDNRSTQLNYSYEMNALTLASLWAKRMQQLMNEENKTVAKVANRAFYEVNSTEMSQFSYAYAVVILGLVWKYGYELKEWFENSFKPNS